MKYSLTGKAVNFHIGENCNMSCKFCFAKYGLKKELNKLDSLQVIQALAKAGIKKINFAGGEPFLKPHLGSLIQCSKSLGLTTGVITNGSKLSLRWLKNFGPSLDWLGISVDSLNNESNLKSGRTEKGGLVQNNERLEFYLQEAKSIGIKTKINTVVSRFNIDDDLSSFIKSVKPDRWKIFKALPIESANSQEDFQITDSEYTLFLKRHNEVMDSVNSFPEDNDGMTSSYIMINPQGQFYSNETGDHVYSDAILEVGVEEAFSQVAYDHSKFLERGGILE